MTVPGGPVSGSPWHALDPERVLALLGSDPERGLTPGEARERLRRVGPNRVGHHRDTPAWQLLLRQFRSLVVLLLLAAAAVASVLGEAVEAVAILAALGLNAAIGFASEWRAQTSLAKLRALATPRARVRRGGRLLSVATAELVPGDLLVLEAGDQVPADARLVGGAALRANEATLTGESAPADKAADAKIAADAPLADRRTMVYLGTSILVGAGLAAVTATGVATELGRIGQLVALAGERMTPLERQVETLGRRLVVAALAICAVVGAAGVLRGQPLGLMLETAIALAIAAIPEGLPAVMAVALAAGLWRLARAGALIRRLPAVETLGAVTVICADKTGTMTENQMTVARVWLDGRAVTVTGGGRSATGSFLVEDGSAMEPRADPVFARLLTAGALANDASVEVAPGGLELRGDPTEAALLVAALKAGLDLADLGRAWPRKEAIPFDPGTRLMATLNEGPEGMALHAKGAPDAILDRAGRRGTREGDRTLTAEDREAVLEANRAMAREGLRVLAIAWRPEAERHSEALRGLTFLGLVGFTDPVRAGVKEAIERCREAGIRSVMLTGDQRPTAEAVGASLGLLPEEIRSRVSPEEKFALIGALQAEGDVVAMTGDGVNDAPALARADIGVAMGRHGTDVAREAAGMVLTDDNFATIVRAVEEGRTIYANLRKVIHFLFSCNLSEILTILVAILLGFPAPLLPLQILWVNLVTDILPAMALVRDPAGPDVMRREPRDPREALVSWRFGARILGEAAVLTAGVLSAYFWALWTAGPGPRSTTIAFVALVLIHPFQAMNCRSSRLHWWQLPPNGLTWVSVATLVGVQWLAVSWGPLNHLLRTVPLVGGDWLVLAAAVLWPVALMEIVKGWRRRKPEEARPGPRLTWGGQVPGRPGKPPAPRP